MNDIEIAGLVEIANAASKAMDAIADNDEADYQGPAYMVLDDCFQICVKRLEKEKGSDWLCEHVVYPHE